MKIGIIEKRQIENEMIFRRANEKVGVKLENLDKANNLDNNTKLNWDNKIKLHFLCECSDENCNARIPINLSTYREIHLNRDSFVIKLKHQVEAIEKVVMKGVDYAVVIKNKSASEPGIELNTTAVDISKI